MGQAPAAKLPSSTPERREWLCFEKIKVGCA
jgi:hypothetical protein